MKILFFDTETTGLHNPRLPHGHIEQPHLLQLGFAVFDENGKNSHRAQLLRSDCPIPIPPQATAVHGLTEDYCRAQGLLIHTILDIFNAYVEASDILVGYNTPYDLAVINHECKRGEPFATQIAFPPNQLDLMQICTPLCALPGKFGHKYSWPKLSVACERILGAPPSQSHDALADVHYTAKLFFKLLADKKIELPVLETAPAPVTSNENSH
jgi:DNA polymerase III epsilon subunit-like protein